jgi:hypothetical protein
LTDAVSDRNSKDKGKGKGTTVTTDEAQRVNAAAASALRDVTRADTHDQSMPQSLRFVLIALAAAALIAVLLVPRAPGLLFARRGEHDDDGPRSRTRRRGVVTMPAGGPRRP